MRLVFQVLHAFVGDVVVQEVQILKLGQGGDMAEPVVGDVRAAAKVERLEVFQRNRIGNSSTRESLFGYCVLRLKLDSSNSNSLSSIHDTPKHICSG